MPNHVECRTHPVLDWVAEHMPEVPINIMDDRPSGEELRKADRRAQALNLQFETITFEKYAMQSAPAALTL